MTDRIAAAYVAACLEELAAPKPGNVHVHADGHGMTLEDFRLSAEVSAEPLCRRGAALGERVLGAVNATRAAVRQNTNLGFVLLCAPLAAAAELSGPLRPNVGTVLEGLTSADTSKVFKAIALAAPGGLGEAVCHDVREAPKVGLLEAMAEASGRDRIARAYVTGLSDVFEIGLGALERAGEERAEPWWPATAVFLSFLSQFPDSHVARKHGSEAAEALRREAEVFCINLAVEGEPLAKLLAFDADLKARGLNPGTSADLTVATLFAAKLDLILRERRDNG